MAEQFVVDITQLPKSTQATLAANAKSRGMTAEEYLLERGGVDPVTKKYGDSYNPNVDLTPDEYTKAIANKTGVDAGKAINAATAAKTAAYQASLPNNDEADGDGPGGGGTGGTGGGGTGGGGTGGSTASVKTAEEIAAEAAKAKAQAGRQSAYNILFDEFNRYGLGALVTPLKDLIIADVSDDEFTLKLRESDAYQKRFSANQTRIKNGLRALSEFEYITKEDAYQEVMRRKGLPPSYYEQTTDPITGIKKQQGFETLIAGDVSKDELEDRIVAAQDRIINTNPEIAQALKTFYPEISNGDILAYSLDPKNAKDMIKRKITTAEIGGSAARFGLSTNVSDAAYLEKYGVDKAMAEEQYAVIGSGLQRGSQLAAIYGEDPYNQATAETERFKLPGLEEARRQRQKITGLEQATFSGRTGVSSAALARDRAGSY
jgi:uncharacterized cysteine cluster protein YcgN (CxxCxxCC family)